MPPAAKMSASRRDAAELDARTTHYKKKLLLKAHPGAISPEIVMSTPSPTTTSSSTITIHMTVAGRHPLPSIVTERRNSRAEPLEQPRPQKVPKTDVPTASEVSTIEDTALIIPVPETKQTPEQQIQGGVASEQVQASSSDWPCFIQQPGTLVPKIHPQQVSLDQMPLDQRMHRRKAAQPKQARRGAEPQVVPMDMQVRPPQGVYPIVQMHPGQVVGKEQQQQLIQQQMANGFPVPAEVVRYQQMMYQENMRMEYMREQQRLYGMNNGGRVRFPAPPPPYPEAVEEAGQQRRGNEQSSVNNLEEQLRSFVVATQKIMENGVSAPKMNEFFQFTTHMCRVMEQMIKTTPEQVHVTSNSWTQTIGCQETADQATQTTETIVKDVAVQTTPTTPQPAPYDLKEVHAQLFRTVKQKPNASSSALFLHLSPNEAEYFRQLAVRSALSNRYASNGAEVGGASEEEFQEGTLSPRQYLLQLRQLYESDVPMEYIDYYTFVTKVQIRSHKPPISFPIFAELYQAGALGLFEDEYKKYLLDKCSLKKTVTDGAGLRL